MSLLRNGSIFRNASHVLGARSTSHCAVNAYGPALILTVSDSGFVTSDPCYSLTFGLWCQLVEQITADIGEWGEVTISARWDRWSGESAGKGGSQMTVTAAGHHLGQGLEKNNYHYPCQEKALQARSC